VSDARAFQIQMECGEELGAMGLQHYGPTTNSEIFDLCVDLRDARARIAELERIGDALVSELASMTTGDSEWRFHAINHRHNVRDFCSICAALAAWEKRVKP
jgi:hypothetical protein